jgi:hypothetical protein
VTIAALVLAARGGPTLARALASVEWASERVVLDPTRRLAEQGLPEGVRRGGLDPAAATTAPWLLLLMEHEVATPDVAAAVERAVREPGDRAGFRVPIEVAGFGARLRPFGAPVRLAARAGARLGFHAVFGAALVPEGRRLGRLRAPLVAGDPSTITQALEQLDADGAALAAILRARRVRPRIRHLLLGSTAAAAFHLTAPARARARFARWALTVFAGYRAMLAYAKLWEIRRAEGAGRR